MIIEHISFEGIEYRSVKLVLYFETEITTRFQFDKSFHLFANE